MRQFINISNILLEAAADPERLPEVYYHGTASEAAALSIMANGIEAPDIQGKGGHLTPVKGRVYLTPDIAYAAIYAVGGSFLGNTSYRVPYEGNEDAFKYVFNDRPGSKHQGRYGYVFVVPVSSLNDIQPDEDVVGELYGWAMTGGPSKFHDEKDHKLWAKFTADPARKSRFTAILAASSTDRQRQKIRDGEYGYFAAVGKKALKKMDDDLKHWLAEIGSHVAHEGKVVPVQCWKVDKTKVGWIEKDGSNFFEIAERIR